jgi:L-lysine 6-transaminase
MDWKVRKNMAAGHGERGTQVLHFRRAFHGRSGLHDEPDQYRSA